MPSSITPVQNSTLVPVPPYRYAGGDLGLTDSDDPWIYFADANGQKWLTHSIEIVLRQLHHFTGDEHGATQLLAAAASHYGYNVWVLIDGYAKARKAWDAAACANILEIFEGESAVAEIGGAA